MAGHEQQSSRVNSAKRSVIKGAGLIICNSHDAFNTIHIVLPELIPLCLRVVFPSQRTFDWTLVVRRCVCSEKRTKPEDGCDGVSWPRFSKSGTGQIFVDLRSQPDWNFPVEGACSRHE